MLYTLTPGPVFIDAPFASIGHRLALMTQEFRAAAA